MRRKIFTLSIAILLICNLSFATIRRVGYNGTPLSGVDYPDFTAAQTASAAGDTIQIYGNVNSCSVNKRLIIIGFGYNFDANPNLQAVGTDAPSYANISFLGGSDSSIVSGVSGNFYIGETNGSHTPVSNITIARCNGGISFYQHQSYGPSSNIKIISSVITGGGMGWNAPTDYPVTNIQVFNCIFSASFNLYKPATTASFINCVMTSPNIIGNYALNLTNANVLVKNCIFGASGYANNTNTVFESNFFAEAQPAALPAGSNNRWSQSWADLFSRNGGTDENASYPAYTQFDEDYYVLKSGSLAVGGGTDMSGNPTDAGIYGGEAAYRYKLSGVPAVPAIYKLTAPSNSATSNPYNITISVRSNN